MHLYFCSPYLQILFREINAALIENRDTPTCSTFSVASTSTAVIVDDIEDVEKLLHLS